MSMWTLNSSTENEGIGRGGPDSRKEATEGAGPTHVTSESVLAGDGGDRPFPHCTDTHKELTSCLDVKPRNSESRAGSPGCGVWSRPETSPNPQLRTEQGEGRGGEWELQGEAPKAVPVIRTCRPVASKGTH